LLLAIGVRVWWAFASNSLPFSDFKRYFDIASEFARTGNLSHCGHSYVFQSPGYPLFLGILFRVFAPSVLVGKLANAGLAILVLAIFWRVLQRQELSPRARVLALLVAGFYPPMITFVSVLGQEMLAIVWVAMILLLVKRGGFLLGLCCGLLTLTRPQFILLPVCLAGLGFVWKWYSKQTCALLLAGFALAMTPWVVRNWLVFHEFIPTTGHTGYVLLVNNNPANHVGVWMPLSKVELTGEQRAEFRALGAESLLEEGDEDLKDIQWTTAVNKAAFRMATDHIKRHPFHFIELAFKRLWNTYFTGGTCALYWAFNGDNKATPRLNDLTDWFAIAIFWLSLAGIVVVAGGREPVSICAALMFLISLLAIFVFEGQGRYVLPSIPASAILIAAVMSKLKI
jgi:hypothetical protein